MKKQLHLLLVLFFVNLLSAQNLLPNDCVNAIVVCGNGTFSSNASGIGTIQEVAGCSGMEHNSLWMKINIVQSGTLGFDLIPNDPAVSVDYDFWVYGPSKTCSSLGAPIRCCTTNALQAGLSSNHTGMNSSSLSTTAGPGVNGTGYVQMLNVVVGQSYYIAIDRPVGEGGFNIQWTGTATTGIGAFPAPPIANKIADLVACTSSNTSFFNLDNGIISQINSDITNNTITFYSTLADATDGKNPISGLVTVNIANPKPIYAKVVNNFGRCYTITDFNLRVFPVPTISGKSSIYVKELTKLTGSGTPATSNAWTSSNPSIATVSSTGLVSGVSVGTVTITYTDINGCSGVFNLAVASNLAVETPTLNDFSAKVYPNPFNTAFVIDVNTLSQEPLKVKVYDMLGRLVEQMEGDPDKMAEQRIGQNYASGIYNIVIAQEDEVKTVRIIKE